MQQVATTQGVLEVVEPDTPRRVVHIDQLPFRIGRGAEEGNHVQLLDKRVSRRSVEIAFADGKFLVSDRGQRQGVFLNGEKIEGQRPLKDSDVITLGSADTVQIVFHSGENQEALPDLLSRLEGLSTLQPGARDLRQLSLLLEATALLQSRLPMEEMLGAMVDHAIVITEADRGLLLEADSEGRLSPFVARIRGGMTLPASQLPPSQTVLTRALKLQHSVVEQDLSQAAEALRAAASVVIQGLRTVIAIPLYSLAQVRSNDSASIIGQRSLLGVLYLDSRRPAAFSNLQRQILDALALEAASVLDNARLVQRERERRRMEQELSIARDIQQALLPRDFGSYPGLEVIGVNRSCLAVGGDYFDLMPMEGNRTAFVIADVCGKGLGAALLGAMLQGSFASLTLGQEISAFFEHINKFICSHSEVRRYATLFFGMIAPEGEFQYVNAGHVAPVLARGDRVTFACEDGFLPVGLLPQATYKACHAKLEPGDTIVFSTDGVCEAMNPEEEMFGNDRLLEAVRQYRSAPIKEMQQGILEAVERFARGAVQSDDLTLLILRYQGPTA